MRMNDRRRHRETMRRTTDSTTSVRSGANTGAGSLAAGDAFSRVRLRQWKTACWRRRLRCVATRTEASEQSPADDATSRSITVSDCLAYHGIRLLGVSRCPTAWRITLSDCLAYRRLSRAIRPPVVRQNLGAPLAACRVYLDARTGHQRYIATRVVRHCGGYQGATA
jgi:hypothetical protein